MAWGLGLCKTREVFSFTVLRVGVWSFKVQITSLHGAWGGTQLLAA